MRVSRLPLLLSVVSALSGCGGSGTATDAGPRPDGAPPRTTVGFTATHHEFPAVDATPGANLYGKCQSWTLNNDEPLYVNAVTMNSDPGWHHSNWVFVPDTLYPGADDVTWQCSDRGFNEVSGAAQGSVFYAQSTQATHEVQQFPPGDVFVIPPHSKVIGSIHVLNVTTAAIHSKLTFDMTLIPESQVVVRLSPLSLTFEDGLVVPAGQTSDTTLSCDFQSTYLANFRRQPDFKIYYLLPHYHQLGTGMTVTAVGGTRDGAVIFDNTARIGDPLGQTLSPPFDMTGATGIKFTCHYDNSTSSTFHFANSLMGEMCVLLAYTDSPLTLGGLSNAGGHDATSTPLPDGTPEFTAPCGVIGIRTPTM